MSKNTNFQANIISFQSVRMYFIFKFIIFLTSVCKSSKNCRRISSNASCGLHRYLFNFQSLNTWEIAYQLCVTIGFFKKSEMAEVFRQENKCTLGYIPKSHINEGIGERYATRGEVSFN